MVTTDAAFLAEVDNFLVSTCGELQTLPMFSVKDAAPYSTLSTWKTKDAMGKHELEKLTDRKRRREYRKRQKLERETLKNEIEKLMKELQKTRDRRLTCQASWKSLAERQLAARLNSESQNHRLRDAISLQANVIKDADSGSLQFRDKVTLPFNFADVSLYRWQAAHLVHRQANREEYADVEDPDNTVALKFRVTTQLKSGQIASAIQHIVLRRYQEEGRMVLVWRLFTEGEGAFSGLHSDETGWGVATPARNVSMEGTVIRTCVTNVPMHFSFKAEQEYTLRQFNTKLLEWGLENNEMVNPSLEKMVIK